MIDIPWTEDDRQKLERTLAEDHMQKLLNRLHLACLPSSKQIAAPGLDLKELASQAHAFSQGQVSLLEKIEEHLPKNSVKPLPKPFQAPKLKEPDDLNDQPPK